MFTKYNRACELTEGKHIFNKIANMDVPCLLTGRHHTIKK